MSKKLFRSRENKVVAGVCGGIGDYFNMDPIWVRLAFVLFTFINGIGIIIYIVAWILVPENPNQKEVKKTTAENAVHKVKTEIKTHHKAHKNVDKKPEKHKGNTTVLFGVILLFIGTVFLMKNIFSWFSMKYAGPLAIIVFALYLITRRGSK
jgi:phage shock protein PspC (stress-responsive transcriptional regulator)|tara:strand:+ start:890 stop:1345 length:456 start_codon:yes stop_codon:yes gene_type:complete